MAHHDGFLGHAKSQSQVVAQVENPLAVAPDSQFVGPRTGRGAQDGPIDACEM